MHRHCTNARRVLIHAIFAKRLLLLLVLIAATGLILPRISHLNSSNITPSLATNRATPALKGDEAIEHLKQQGTYGSLQEAIAAVGYQATWQTSPAVSGIGAGFEFKNQPNNLLAYITADGLHATGLAGAKKSWRLDLRLQDYGYGQIRSIVRAGTLSAKANRVEIKRSGVLGEWFVNTRRGIEHGFTLTAPPGERKEGQPLRLRFDVTGDLPAKIDACGAGVYFKRKSDDVLLTYQKLFVTDANGVATAATLKLEGTRLVIEVSDEKAVYPLTIDPLLREQVKLVPSEGSDVFGFGAALAVSGDTVVVGAPSDVVGANSSQGSAWVFVRRGTGWSEEAKLTASDGAANDSFGESIAISGDTIVVAGGGSAYVFERTDDSWWQQAKLTAPDSTSNFAFVSSVAIDGDTIVAGARGAWVGANHGQGSAYVFQRSGADWTQQAKLIASDGAADDRFGCSVAISGDTVVVGASLDNVGFTEAQGSAYVFVRDGLSWTQQQKIVAYDGRLADQFGESVGISGNTIVVGAAWNDFGAGVDENQGSAYIFERVATTWTQQAELLLPDGAAFDLFGNWVAIDGDTVVVGGRNRTVGANIQQGEAYIFRRNGVSWEQAQILRASDGTENQGFGDRAAISGDTVVISGMSTYIFVGDWSQQALLTQTSGLAGDNFGRSVAVSGNTAVVGAPLDDVGGKVDQGSAAVFVRSGGTWAQQQLLTAGDGQPGDNFGSSVGLSGNTVVVGSPNDDVGGNTDQGSTYVFVRFGSTWVQTQRLIAPDGAAQDQFGNSVAISGETIVIGAVGDESSQGSAYVFERVGGTWTAQQQLIASDGSSSDGFANSVAISGDVVVVGAPGDDVGVNTDQGSSYVFARSGASWYEQQHLISVYGADSDAFGSSVAVSGDTIVVGSPGADVTTGVNQGSASIFLRSGVSWMEQGYLTGFGGATGEAFGASVAVNGDTVVVGAPMFDLLLPNRGAAYLFVGGGFSWTLRQELTQLGAFTDKYGSVVAVSGSTVMVGAPLRDVSGRVDQGAAYVFSFGFNTTPAITTTGTTRQKGSAAAIATIANVFDSEDPIGYLSVTVASAPAGILINNVTNTNGVITASVSAACSAVSGNNLATLRVQDSDGGTITVGLVITVTPNTTPTLGVYPDISVLATESTIALPAVPPSDNGTIVSFNATSPTFAGGLSAESESGLVTIDDARPAGVHLVTVTAIDNCGAARSRGFILTVTCQTITVNPTAIAQGLAGTPYTQTFTQTGGNGAVSFSLNGTLPAGMGFAGATLSGTPTQVGSFPVTVTTTDVNGCSGSRNYTLTINAPLLTWTGNTSSDWHTATNWSPNAVPSSFHDVLIPTAGVVNQPTISVSSSAIHAMTLQTGRILTINSSRQLTAQGDITSSGQITGAGLMNCKGATFTQNGSVSVASVQFDIGSHLLTGGGSFASGIVTVLGGASVTLASNHSLSVLVINSGGVFNATDRTLTLTGAGTPIFNSGSFTATGSTIIYQGTISQVVTPGINYSNLTTNNLAGVFLTGDTTVSGLLNLATDLTTGAFVLIMPASGSSAGSGDVIGNVKRVGLSTGGAALSFGNSLNSIQINSGTAPDDITMNLVKLAPFGFSNCVSRTYSISANGGSGFSATMRLRYKDIEAGGLDESSFQLWRYSAPGWVSPPGTATRNISQKWVEESGITQFSQWTIAGGSGPSCGVLTPNSQFFPIVGATGSVAVTALPGCSWAAQSSASWLEITSSQQGAGTDVVTYIVRDNFASTPRQAVLTIAGRPFTVVQDSEAAPDCAFYIATTFAAFNSSGGTGSVDVTAEERCAWQAVSNVSWVTITSTCCGIGKGTVSYSVAPNTSPAGRVGTISIAGKAFQVKQKGS